MIEKMYRWHCHYGRQGTLDSLFLATDKDIENIKNCGSVYLGEVLGKHSEVVVDFSEENFDLVTDDPKVISVMKTVLPIGVDIFGHAEEQIHDLEQENQETEEKSE